MREEPVTPILQKPLSAFPLCFIILMHILVSTVACIHYYICLVFNFYYLLHLYRLWGSFGHCIKGVNNAHFQRTGRSAALLEGWFSSAP